MNDQQQLYALSNPLIVATAVTCGSSKRMLRTHCDTGYKLADGSRLTLRAEMQNGQYMTCPEWVRAFYAEVDAAAVRGKTQDRSTSV